MKNGWITDNNGNKYHYVDGKVHSINDEPSSIWKNGTKAWHKEGELHRELGPAFIWYDGEKEYYFEGKGYHKITSNLEWLMKVAELRKNK